MLCPSLEQAADSLLLVSRKGNERTLMRADGAVHVRHTLPFDYATEAYLNSDAGLAFAAVQYGLADVTDRSWQIARFDADGGLLDERQGVLPAPSDAHARIDAPVIRLQRNAIAFDQADGDSWLVDFDGTPRLLECEQRLSLGSSEESRWTGAWIQLRSGGSQAAFVDELGGKCRRVTNLNSRAETASFLHGRFQYLHAASGSPLLSDEGPSSTSDFPLSLRDPDVGVATLHAISNDVLYVLAAPDLARYDAVARALSIIELPSAAASFSLHGNRLVGHEQGLPLWSYDLLEEITIEYDLEASAATASSRGSQDFLLVWIDERPTTWLAIATAETRSFEVMVPESATLETIESGARALLLADGLPIAHIDLEAGRATAIDFERSDDAAQTFRDGEAAFVVLDGVPAFRVEIESGTVEPVKGAAGLASGARTDRSGPHVIVSIDGRPRALLDTEAVELVPLVGLEPGVGAVKLLTNDRYIVGFDERSWPIFRVDVPRRALTSYAVTGPSDLVGFRAARYLEAPGDALYEQHYASSLADAEVLEDGSVAVALRDARQGRLWLVSPEDSAFRPIGRPVTGVIALGWHTQQYSFQIFGERGDCYCQPPVLRWEHGADADVLLPGSVQLVARAHSSLIIVRSDYLVEADTSGVCVIEQAPVPLVHDLLAGTTAPLEGVDGEVRFLEGRN